MKKSTAQKQILLAFCFFILISAFTAKAADITSTVVVSILPNKPTNLTASSASYNQINLSWTDTSNNEDGFSIERKSGGGSFSEISNVSQNIANYTDNSVSANATYTYRVRAASSDGYSEYSNEALTTTGAAPTPPTPPASGGGGGGGGAGGFDIISNLANEVFFKGIAYPKSKVSLLKDAQIVATTVAGEDARFEIRISGITSGSHNFGVIAEDQQGNKSTIHQFNFILTSGVTTVVSGIFIAPTIQVDKLEVSKGEPISILGQSIPNATISIIVNSEKQIIQKAKSDKYGAWLYKLDTSVLEFGDHSAKANAATEEDISTFSKSVGFKVGTKNILTPKTEKPEVSKVDSNGDGKINLIDFSVMAYWYRRPLGSAPKNTKERVDINKDGKVDLIDFSILAYYWTG